METLVTGEESGGRGRWAPTGAGQAPCVVSTAIFLAFTSPWKQGHSPLQGARLGLREAKLPSGSPTQLKSPSVSPQQLVPCPRALHEPLPISEPLFPPSFPRRIPCQPRLILPGHRHRLFRGTAAPGDLLTLARPSAASPSERTVYSMRRGTRAPLCGRQGREPRSSAHSGSSRLG